MEHRGPDAAGFWESPDSRVCMGHRRLAIVDLDTRSNQPMALSVRDGVISVRLPGSGDEGGIARLVITFNGEIYNWRSLREKADKEARRSGLVIHWQTQSDTEVLLVAWLLWGPECLSKLNGMFAFAIWDREVRALFFARDRAGKKPLFFRRSSMEIAWASEIKALLEFPEASRNLDRNALWRLLSDGYSGFSETVLEGVEQLAPGRWARFDLQSGDWCEDVYWTLPEFDRACAVEGKPAEEQFEAILEDSVRLRLEADVPVGILLSGGVDSSLITCAASRLKPDLKTFTVTFEGHGSYDESAHARLVADELGTDHHELKAESVGPEILDDLVPLFDHPFIDSSVIPTFLVSRLIRQHCTVALGGDGGDELFGGYAHLLMNLATRKRGARVPRILLSFLTEAAGRFLPTGFRGRNALLCMEKIRSGHLHGERIFDRFALRRVLNPGLWQNGEAGTAAKPADAWNDPASIIDHILRDDFAGSLACRMLPKVDRASMAASLEIRSPMLDCRLIDFAFGQLPVSEKTSGNRLKILPKKVLTRKIPKLEIERKQGFSAPVASWIRGPWRARIEEILHDAPWFRPREIQRLLRTQDRGGSNSERLFALAMLELWRRKYRISA